MGTNKFANTKFGEPTKYLCHVDDIIPLDSELLVSIQPKPKMVGNIHLTEGASASVYGDTLRSKVLKIGTAVEKMNEEKGYNTPIQVGDEIIVRGEVMVMNVLGLPEGYTACLIDRSEIRFLFKNKNMDKTEEAKTVLSSVNGA